jgi:diadenylate cyclase
MDKTTEQTLLDVLEKVAPGTGLRSGIEQILRAGTGALIVIGDTDEVMKITNGGFAIDCEFSPYRLYELAKMDGAIVLDDHAQRVLFANVHLVPDSSLATSETGIRHRTAERVAKQTRAVVISISQKREIVSVYFSGSKHVLEDIPVVLAKANQALQTLERYKSRLDQVAANLGTLEFEDLVAVSDVAAVVQRGEMVERVAAEVNRFITELGVDGRLLKMQLDELMGTVPEDALLVIRDYCAEPRLAEGVKQLIAEMDSEELLDFLSISAALGYDGPLTVLDKHVHPRGYRLLKRIPRLPVKIVNKIVDRFGSLRAVVDASIDQLDDVDGIGAVRAQAIQDGLRRLKEYNLLERYS